MKRLKLELECEVCWVCLVFLCLFCGGVLFIWVFLFEASFWLICLAGCVVVVLYRAFLFVFIILLEGFFGCCFVWGFCCCKGGLMVVEKITQKKLPIVLITALTTPPRTLSTNSIFESGY